MQQSPSKILLNWYAENGRRLPWRTKTGEHTNPYVILVSEFMLQQTTVKSVIPYFKRFMQRFPTIESLAQADIEDIYALWQGLGYYTRARSLHSTAQTIVSQGFFPKTRAEALKLKGIGKYTAASFLALSFNLPETVIDGNVIRVICRLYNLTSPIKEIEKQIEAKAEFLTDRKNPADYASAIMDLGALICTPKNPQCLICPWQKFCLSKNSTNLEKIPNRSTLSKKEKQGCVYLIYNKKGDIFITKRKEKGLLSGLYEFPWSENETPIFSFETQNTEQQITHTFTHFKLNLKIYTAHISNIPEINGQFVPPLELAKYPFSTLMKKVYIKINKNFPTQ